MECNSTWLAVNEKFWQLYLYVYYWDLFSRNFHNAQVSLGFFGVIHSSRFYRAAPWPVLQQQQQIVFVLRCNNITILSYFFL
jgi:hypothetical protein